MNTDYDPIYRDDDPRARSGIGYRSDNVVIPLGRLMPLSKGSRLWRILGALIAAPIFFIVGGLVCVVAALYQAQQKPYLYKTKDLATREQRDGMTRRGGKAISPHP